MDRRYNYLILIMVLLLGLFAASCKSKGDGGPNLPSPGGPQGGGYGGDQPEPPIPTPFADLTGRLILDMQWEADGDLVASTDQGILLFTPYGIFKRNLGGSANVFGLANNDSGRGMSYYSTDSMCNPAGAWDDQYVSGGTNTTTFHQLWYNNHQPDLPDDGVVEDSDACVPGVTLGWTCPSGVSPPCGYEYHPYTQRTYILLGNSSTLIGDANGPVEGCGYSDFCPPQFLLRTANCVLSYDQLAPFMDGIMNGPGDSDLPDGDFVYYINRPDWDRIWMAINMGGCGIYSYFLNTTKAILWDGYYPPEDYVGTPIDGMVDRDGITIDNVEDFDFDAQARMILSIPNGDSYVITQPVTDGDHMIVDRIVGGRQNGMGTGPGEFQGPTGIMVDPRNQNHIVCDSGNDRVQIFDAQGNYIRQFMTTYPNPRVCLVDYWGNILIATDAGLEIFNEQGSIPIYGSINGFVIDKQSRLPLENALVYITSTFRLPIQGATTNKDGYFNISTVPAGTVNLVAIQNPLSSSSTYFNSSVMVEVTQGQATETTIYMTRIPVSSPGTGNVTGTCMSAVRSEPIAGIKVGILGTGISDTSTNNGEFMLIGVQSGPQKIQLSSNGVIIWEKNIQVPDSQTLDMGYIKLQM